MGGEYNRKIIPDEHKTLSEKELRAAFQETIEQCEYDYGHDGYSGTFAEKEGITIRPEIFDTEESAESFINSLDTSKWDDADAVYVRGIGWLIAGWCSA